MSKNGSQNTLDVYIVAKVLSLVSNCISVGEKDKFYMDKEVIIKSLESRGVSFINSPEHFFEKQGIDFRVSAGKYSEAIIDLAKHIQLADSKEKLLYAQKIAEEISNALYPYK